MGILKISDLDRIIPKDFKEKYKMVSKPIDYVSYTAILRDIMIIHNPEQYFDVAYRPEYYNTLDYHAYKVHHQFKVDSSYFPDGLDVR